MKRYHKFEIYNNLESKAIYSSKNIGAIKRYIAKHDIEVTISASLLIRCYESDLREFIAVSLYDFYNRTGATATGNKILQQEFHRDYRNSRYINVGM